MKKPFLIILLSAFILTGSILVKAVVSGMVSTYGTDLGALEKEAQEYKVQNMTMRQELLTLTSLNNIASAAAELGFAETKSQIVLSKSLPLAKR